MIVINIVIVFLLGYLFVKINKLEKLIKKEKPEEENNNQFIPREPINLGNLWSRLYGKK